MDVLGQRASRAGRRGVRPDPNLRYPDPNVRSESRCNPVAYRGTSLIRNSAPLGPYSRTMPRALWRS